MRTTEPDRVARGAGLAVLTYNLLRLALLAVCVGIGLLIGVPGLWLIVSALVVSGVLSYFLLGKYRVAMGVALEQRVTRTRSRLAERTAAEDAYVDAMSGSSPTEATDARPSQRHLTEPR